MPYQPHQVGCGNGTGARNERREQVRRSEPLDDAGERREPSADGSTGSEHVDNHRDTDEIAQPGTGCNECRKPDRHHDLHERGLPPRQLQPQWLERQHDGERKQADHREGRRLARPRSGTDEHDADAEPEQGREPLVEEVQHRLRRQRLDERHDPQQGSAGERDADRQRSRRRARDVPGGQSRIARSVLWAMPLMICT